MLSNALFWKIHGLHLLASLPIAGAEAGSRSEPIQEVRIQEQRVGLVNRRSMMRIIARRMNAAADRA
jgi:hypothetical protein